MYASFDASCVFVAAEPVEHEPKEIRRQVDAGPISRAAAARGAPSRPRSCDADQQPIARIAGVLRLVLVRVSCPSCRRPPIMPPTRVHDSSASCGFIGPTCSP